MGKYFAEVVRSSDVKYFLNSIPNLKRIISISPHSGRVDRQECHFHNVQIVWEVDFEDAPIIQMVDEKETTDDQES